MPNPEINRFPSDTTLAQAAAEEWLKLLTKTKQPSGKWLVALSGGRIVRRLFQATVATACASRSDDWEAVHFFWGDERCVPPTDPESNYGIASLDLLEPLKIRSQNIHRIRGEEMPEVAARGAAAELQGIAPATSSGQPIFDLIFLGMGEDGHVASLFPSESEAQRASSAIYRPVVATKPPPHRITIGYQVIAAARQVWVLASGAGKAEALRESLKSTGSTPLANVLRSRGETRIFTDISD